VRERFACVPDLPRNAPTAKDLLRAPKTHLALCRVSPANLCPPSFCYLEETYKQKIYLCD